MTPTSEPLRLAVIDGDPGFVRVLENRLQAAGWGYRVHESTLPPDELVAMRLNALVVDPSYLGADAGPVVAGELEVRADQFQAFVAGRSVDLTRREFEVLQALVGASGQVLQREELYQRVWGYAMAHGDRSVDVFVRKLRQKLEQASPTWQYIHTHFGIGYRFQPLGEEAAEPPAPAQAA